MQGFRDRKALALRALFCFISWVMPAASFAAAFAAADFGSPAVAVASSTPAFESSATGFDVGLAGPTQSVRADGLAATGWQGHASTIFVATAAIPAAPCGPERTVRHPDIRLYPTG